MLWSTDRELGDCALFSARQSYLLRRTDCALRAERVGTAREVCLSRQPWRYDAATRDADAFLDHVARG